MKKIVLLVNGAATAGKDLLIDTLSKEYPVLKTSIIDPAKKIAKKIGWDGGKEDTDRRFLASLKTLLDNFNSYSFYKTIEFVHDKINTLEDQGEKNCLLICIVAREPKDIDAFKAYFTGQSYHTASIFIRRAEAEKNLPDNPADQGVFGYDYDYYIENNGSIEDFQEKTFYLIKNLLMNKEGEL